MKKIKIQPKHRKRTYDEIWIPEIRMEGIWLKELGFEIGKEIKIEQQKNRLIITLTDNKNKK